MPKIYRGLSDGDVLVNEVPLSPAPSQAIINHSPDGFAWGYQGSGPAQLGLAILLDYYGDAEKAQNFYQRFKSATVATWPASGWTITGTEIENTIAMLERES